MQLLLRSFNSFKKVRKLILKLSHSRYVLFYSLTELNSVDYKIEFRQVEIDLACVAPDDDSLSHESGSFQWYLYSVRIQQLQ